MQKMLDKVLRLVSALQADVDAMAARPTPTDGASGRDGTDGRDGNTGGAGAAGQNGEKGTDGKDGRDGRDGKSVAAEDVATLVQSRIKVPVDGKTGAQGETGPQGQRGPRGPKGEIGAQGEQGLAGAAGRDGSSITALSIKDNKLFAAIDGRNKEVGALKFDAPAVFTPGTPSGASGGGGAGYAKKSRLDALGWDAQYAPGKTVPELTAVHDEGWTMVSNKITDERAAPEPTGPEAQIFNGTLVPENDTAKQIIFGTRYAVTEAGYALGYRVDTVAGNEYQVFLVQDPLGAAPIISELVVFTADSTGWQEFNIGTLLLLPGNTFDIVAIVHEPDPTPVSFNGDWDYLKPGGGGGTTRPPLSGEIVHPNNASNIFRVSKTDDNSAERSSELATLTVGDIIVSQGVRWAIQTIVDDITYYSYTVAPAVQAQDQGVFDFVFETVVATPITFGRDLNYWDNVGLSTVRGLLGVDTDYANVSVLPDAFGVDLRVQAASISGDWDLMAVSGAASSSTGAGRLVETQTLGTFETSVVQTPTGLGAAGVITVNYGTGGSTDGGEFDVAGTGVISVNEASGGAQYNFEVGLRIGRAGAAGISIPVIRFMYSPDGIVGNAVQVGGTFSVEIEDANTTWREFFDIDFAPVVGSVVFVQFARDPAGANSGGIQAPQPTGDISDWNPVATARIEIKRRVTI